MHCQMADLWTQFETTHLSKSEQTLYFTCTFMNPLLVISNRERERWSSVVQSFLCLFQIVFGGHSLTEESSWWVLHDAHGCSRMHPSALAVLRGGGNDSSSCTALTMMCLNPMTVCCGDFISDGGWGPSVFF